MLTQLSSFDSKDVINTSKITSIKATSIESIYIRNISDGDTFFTWDTYIKRFIIGGIYTNNISIGGFNVIKNSWS